jgi:hypothetical protein
MNDPFIGTWKLNIQKSQFDENHKPKAGTMVVELDAAGYYLQTAEGINEKGEKCVERPARFIPDGQLHPIPDLPGLKFVTSRTGPNSLSSEARREDGSVVGGGTTVVSADGKTKTVSNFGYDSQLRQFKLTTVWDRQ